MIQYYKGNKYSKIINIKQNIQSHIKKEKILKMKKKKKERVTNDKLTL